MKSLKLSRTTVDEFSSLLSHPFFPLKCPDDALNNYRELNRKESNQVTKLWKIINQERRKGNSNIVLRGHKKKSLRDALFASPFDKDNDSELAKKIFYFGAKAKAYSELDRRSGEKLFENINDVSEDAFHNIFKLIHDVLADNSGELDHFKYENPDFSNYFAHVNNVDDFVQSLTKLPESEVARDYYLYFLHTSEKYEFTSSSFFISTSEDASVARRFALSGGSGRIDSQTLIFVCFLPKEAQDYGYSIARINKLSQDYRSKGLPTYSTDIYDEKEVSIKGGLFPHFLMGYFDLEKYCFVVNPYLFNQSLSMAKIAEKGFKIDQSDFSGKIRDTNFKTYVWAISNSFRDHDVV